MEEVTSDFGKGFIYNLILFAKHWAKWAFIDRDRKPYSSHDTPEYRLEMWFNGSSDHMEQFEIPKKYEGTEIGNRAKALAGFITERHLCLNVAVRLEDFDYVFNELEEIALLIDKDLGVEPVKAEWN